MEKTLNISYAGLPQNTNLMLCMDKPDSTKIGQDNNLVAWKVIIARANQNGTARVTYSSRYAVGENESDVDNRVEGSIIRELAQGQSADLVEDEDGYPIWGPAKNNGDGLIRGRNMTNYRRNMSVGTVTGSGATLAYQPTFAWANVGKGLTVEVQLTPKMYCFVNYGYQETDIIRGDITSEAIQTIMLSDLKPSTNWVFAQGAQGDFTLTQAVNPLEDSIASTIPSDLTSLAMHQASPHVKINYSLQLCWNSSIQDSDAEETIQSIVAACNTKGLICRVDRENNRHSRFDLTVFRKGYTAHRIYTTFASILADNIDSNWSVGDETYTNAVSKDHKRRVFEWIAPKSLAWYYAK
jgi:hypothetical protein